MEPIISKALQEKDQEDEAETAQRNIRRKRLIISNIPDEIEKAEDSDFVVTFAKELDIEIKKDIIKKTFRIKRKNYPNKPMLTVEFHKVSDKLKFLDPSVFAKIKSFESGHNYHKYYVSHDRTIKQRENHNRLLAQAAVKNAELQSTGNPNNMIYIVCNEVLAQVKKRLPPDQ